MNSGTMYPGTPKKKYFVELNREFQDTTKLVESQHYEVHPNGVLEFYNSGNPQREAVMVYSKDVWLAFYPAP